jgi:hypothetical protein
MAKKNSKIGRPKGRKDSKPRPVTKFCPRGHDKDVTGRDPNSACSECRRYRERRSYIPHPRPKQLTRFCPQGHDKDIVGRTVCGACKECESIRSLAWNNAHYIPKKDHNFCIQGHDLRILGRDKAGHCKACSKEYKQRNAEKLHAQSIAYYLSHIEEIKKYKQEHPEQTRVQRIKQETKRNLRIVAWTDWDKIKEFYINMPVGMTEDHIIPLQGKKVSGFHLSWNLQYLTPNQNSSKGNKCTPEEATRFYERVLIEAGLK